jgi:hypothetical protein
MPWRFPRAISTRRRTRAAQLEEVDDVEAVEEVAPVLTDRLNGTST